MSEMPEQAKTMQRMMRIVILLAVFGAIAFVGVKWFTPHGETACPDGFELVKQNPPVKQPRFKCVRTEIENNAEN